jgi:hypothetical protein
MDQEKKIKTLAIMTICIGRKYCDDLLFSYYRHVNIPNTVRPSLYLILAKHSYVNRISHLVKKYNLQDKYESIHIIPGREGYVTRDKAIQKHLATGINLNIGLSRIVEEYVHIVDDDVIPPKNCLTNLFSSIHSESNAGAVAGIYFLKKWNNMENSLWRGDKTYARAISVCTGTAPETIDTLSKHNTRLIKYSGNGCLLAYSKYIKYNLPVKTKKIKPHIALGPDYDLCDSIRLNNRQLYVQPHVICEHYSELGPVGLGVKQFEKIIYSDINNNKNILILKEEHIKCYEHISNNWDLIYVVGKHPGNNKYNNIHYIDIESIDRQANVLIELNGPEYSKHITRKISDELVYGVMNSVTECNIHSRLEHTNAFVRLHGDIINQQQLQNYYKPINITKKIIDL